MHVQQVGASLTTMERHEAMSAMDKLRERLSSKYTNVADAFKHIDIDDDSSLSYDEFGLLVRQWLPEVSQQGIHKVWQARPDGLV